MTVMQTILACIGLVTVGSLLVVALGVFVALWSIRKAERDEARDVLERMGEE